MGGCCAAEDQSVGHIQATSLARKPAVDMDITISKGDGTPKIYYFGFYGRAEPIRMIMEVAGVKYDDVRMSFEQFGALK